MKPQNLMNEPGPENVIKAEEYINEKFLGTKPFKMNKDVTGIRTQQTKIEMLEKETFLLKLQLSYYQEVRRIDMSSKRVMEMQIQNDALKHDIRAKQVIIWKAFQILKRFEGITIPCAQKTSSRNFDQHLQKYEFKNQINNSDILKTELSVTLAINALLSEKNRGYEGFLLKAQEENHRIATIFRNLNRKYHNSKLDLINSETKCDIIMSQVKANEQFLRELEENSTTQILTINELLCEAVDSGTLNGLSNVTNIIDVEADN